MALFEGDFIGKAASAEVGMRKGKLICRIDMEVAEGDRKGQRAAFEGKFDEDNIKWTKLAMLAVGWKGKTIATFPEDVKAANLTVPFTTEIATHTYEDSGKTRQWTAVRRIGAGAKPLDQVDADKMRSIDKWLAETDVGMTPPPSNGTAGQSKPPF